MAREGIVRGGFEMVQMVQNNAQSSNTANKHQDVAACCALLKFCPADEWSAAEADNMGLSTSPHLYLSTLYHGGARTGVGRRGVPIFKLKYTCQNWREMCMINKR